MTRVWAVSETALRDQQKFKFSSLLEDRLVVSLLNFSTSAASSGAVTIHTKHPLIPTMTDDNETLRQDIADYLQQQFEAFQLTEDTSNNVTPAVAWNKAASILKHVQILALNNGISQQALTGVNEDDETTLSSLITPFLLLFVDASMASAVDDDVVSSRVFGLTSAVACSLVVNGNKSLQAVQEVLERAKEWSEVLLDRIRTSACVLMASLATQLGGLLRQLTKQSDNDAQVEDILTLLQSMERTLLFRLTDKTQGVRQAAIRATGELLAASSQHKPSTANEAAKEDKGDSDEEEDSDDDDEEEEDDDDDEEEESNTNQALEGLLWSMWHDPSIANRIEAIDAVPISLETVDHIVARIRDVKEKVRIAALDVLRTKVEPRVHMAEEHFCDVIQHGLTERCEATKAATLKLVCTKWMKVAKFDPVELLRLMGATANDQECEKAMKAVLTTIRSGDHSPMQELSDPEIRSIVANIDKCMIHLKDADVVFDEHQLFYTRMVCSSAKESSDMTYAQKEDLINKAAPDIPTLCDLFQKHLAQLKENIREENEEGEDQECFVCLQLLQLAKIAGLQEEGSRRHFAGVLAKALSNIGTPDDLVEESVEALRAAYDDNEMEFFNAISVVIAALTAGQDEDFVMDEEKIAATNLRVLFIFSAVLEHATSDLSSHDLLDNMVKIILSAVSSTKKSIREVGISCFGKVGLFSKEETILNEFKPILLQIMSNAKEALQCRGQALLALADWSLLFADILERCEDDDGTSISLLDCIQDMMQHSNDSIIALSSEVAAKLLFTGRVSSTQLMGRLLTIFLDPNRQKESDSDEMEADEKAVGSQLRLQQLLSLFFPAFCFKSKESRKLLLDSINPAMKVAAGISKTKKRPLVFPLIKIVDYVASVVEQSAPEAIENEQRDGVEDLNVVVSLQVARFLVKQEEKLSVTQRRALCKYLGAQHIDLSKENKSSLLKLKGYVEDLTFVADTSSAKSLRPLADLLEDVQGEIEDVEEAEVGPNTTVNTVTEENSNVENEISDDETVTEHSENDHDDASSGESTVEDLIMDSLASLSKENTSRRSTSKTVLKVRRSSAQSSVSVLESLGSFN
jgi:hypothetical protein